MEAWLEPARAAGVVTETIFDEGYPVHHILERARTLSADLIVMGTRAAAASK